MPSTLPQPPKSNETTSTPPWHRSVHVRFNLLLFLCCYCGLLRSCSCMLNPLCNLPPPPNQSQTTAHHPRDALPHHHHRHPLRTPQPLLPRRQGEDLASELTSWSTANPELSPPSLQPHPPTPCHDRCLCICRVMTRAQPSLGLPTPSPSNASHNIDPSPFFRCYRLDWIPQLTDPPRAAFRTLSLTRNHPPTPPPLSNSKRKKKNIIPGSPERRASN